MAFTPDRLSAASQLAVMRALQAGPGFSTDEADYRALAVKLAGPEFNQFDPKYRVDLPPDGFLIGNIAIAPEGVPVIVLGSVSGVEERDRVTINGKETTKRHALWKVQPDVTPVTGKGGGLRTERGGWLSGKFDEVFLLTPHGLAVLSMYDQHHIVADLNQRAPLLGAAAMYEVKWTLTKAKVPDGDYTKYEPHFTPLGLAGSAEGPAEVEIAQARRLSAMIRQISHPHPDVPLKLVVGGPSLEAPDFGPSAPPPASEDDYGANDPNSEIPF
jgi:hypothetical protein